MANYNPKRKTEFDGRRALIVGSAHPQKGNFAICLGAFRSPSGLYQMVFKSEITREEFLVPNGGDINWVL